jgi:hypothetical protein
MKFSATIVVPVYKTKLDNMEILSFKQCIKILGKYPIALICPKFLDISSYIKIAIENNKFLLIETFEDFYFSNIEGYN